LRLLTAGTLLPILAFAIISDSDSVFIATGNGFLTALSKIILSTMLASNGGKIKRFSGSSFSVRVVRQNGVSEIAGSPFGWQLCAYSLVRIPVTY
jgi:hypothetical protein